MKIKTYNVTKRISSAARKSIEGIINTNNKYKGSYFFSPSSDAYGRRRNEQRFQEENPSVNFIDGKNLIEVSFEYRESCKNVYYYLDIRVNGMRKDIRTLKAYLK